jgi:antitoxin (DNA-binding transcriptional repressor) of toxin-antitoxin stability system
MNLNKWLTICHGHITIHIVNIIKGKIMVKKMPISFFKTHCLRLIDELSKHSTEEIIITKNAKPIAKIAPIVAEKKESLVDAFRGKIEITGDIESPLECEWDAEKGVLYNER